MTTEETKTSLDVVIRELYNVLFCSSRFCTVRWDVNTVVWYVSLLSLCGYFPREFSESGVGARRRREREKEREGVKKCSFSFLFLLQSGVQV